MIENPSLFLSVVIPTYNRKDSLRKTLDGLSRQTYPLGCFEAIVISDGSTDGTNSMIAAYAQTASFPLRLISQPNSGPACARNNGVAKALGDVIVFLDDDVEPGPKFLALHAAHHVSQQNCVVIGPMLPDPALQWQEQPWIAWEHAMLEKQYTAWRTGEWTGCGPHHFYSGNASLRRSHLVAVGGFDEQFPRQEDVELAVRLEKQCGVHFVYEPNAPVTHRPQRRFASWLAVPYAYGELDVVRARRGDVSWEVVRHGYHARSRATRLLAKLILAVPALSQPLRGLLLPAARSAYRLHQAGPAFAALSVVYNLRYLEGAQQEIGSRAEMSRLLFAAPAAESSGAKFERML
ncbi:MAG: exopolysaccharide biosynthesis glycosyltransferase EpsD [Janthinobacterium lividum]